MRPLGSKRKKKKRRIAAPPAPRTSRFAPAAAFFKDPWVWIIFTAALAARLVYIFYFARTPFFDAPLIDAEMYDTRAWNMVGGALPEKIFYQAPMYSVFLASVYFVFGHSYAAARIVQAFIGSVSCVLVYVLARKTIAAGAEAGGAAVEEDVGWNSIDSAASAAARAAGRLAGLCAAFYGPMIHYDAALLRPVLVIFFALLMMLALLEWFRTRRMIWLAASGVLLGISAITRENILLFGPAAALLLFVAEEKKSLARRLVAPAVFSIAVAAAVVPVTVRNYIVEGDLVPVSPQGGMNFFIGNSAESGRLTALQPGIDWDRMAFSPRDELGYDAKPSEYSAWFFDRTFEYIAAHPVEWLGKLAAKFALFWTGEELTPNSDLEWFRARNPVLRALMFRAGPLFIPFGLVTPLFAAGMYLWRPRGAGWWTIVCFVGAYMLSVVLFHVRSRYRLPVVPFMLPAAAYAAAWFYLAARRRRFRAAAVPAAIFVAVLIFVNAPWVDTGFARGFPTEYFVAKAYVKTGNDEKAIEAFERAVKEYPGYAEMRHDYGQALIRLDRFREGVLEMEAARALAPDCAFIRKNLGQMYRREYERLEAAAGRLEQAGEPEKAAVARRQAGDAIRAAVAEHEAAEHADPYDVTVLYDHALLCEQAGMNGCFRRKLREFIEAARDRPAEAEWVRRSKKLLASEAFNPGGGASAADDLTPQQRAFRHIEKAQFYIRGRSYAKARDELAAALELDPRMSEAHALMGNLYKKQGRVDDAEKAYLRAIELDPSSLLAHNNLANIYRDSGRYRAAVEHYTRALELAPDNPVIKKNRMQLMEKMQDDDSR